MRRGYGELSTRARAAGLSVQTLSGRLNGGWTMEKALSTPAARLGLSEAASIDAHLDRIIRDGLTDCWLWPGNVNGGGSRSSRGGYASVRVGGRMRQLRVVLWERLHGPVPDGFVLGSLCRVRRCCNPDHAERRTHIENVRLGGNGGKTHCKRGHEFTVGNTRFLGGTRWPRRACRACEVDRDQRQRRVGKASWIEAPTSGILHVAGDGYPRQDCKAGIRLLCGWVISCGWTVHSKKRVRDSAKAGLRCAACARWLRTHAAAA